MCIKFARCIKQDLKHRELIIVKISAKIEYDIDALDYCDTLS